MWTKVKSTLIKAWAVMKKPLIKVAATKVATAIVAKVAWLPLGPVSIVAGMIIEAVANEALNRTNPNSATSTATPLTEESEGLVEVSTLPPDSSKH